MANFGAFHQVISSSINLLFLKSVLACSDELERTFLNSNFFLSLEQDSTRVGVSHQDGNLRSPQWKFFQQACTSFSPRPKMAPIQANKWMNREGYRVSDFKLPFLSDTEQRNGVEMAFWKDFLCWNLDPFFYQWFHS